MVYITHKNGDERGMVGLWHCYTNITVGNQQLRKILTRWHQMAQRPGLRTTDLQLHQGRANHPADLAEMQKMRRSYTHDRWDRYLYIYICIIHTYIYIYTHLLIHMYLSTCIQTLWTKVILSFWPVNLGPRWGLPRDVIAFQCAGARLNLLQQGFQGVLGVPETRLARGNGHGGTMDQTSAPTV